MIGVLAIVQCTGGRNERKVVDPSPCGISTPASSLPILFDDFGGLQTDISNSMQTYTMYNLASKNQRHVEGTVNLVLQFIPPRLLNPTRGLIQLYSVPENKTWKFEEITCRGQSSTGIRVTRYCS